MKRKCSSCLGYGFWCWSHIAPMGSIDAEDGTPTIACPECGANPNKAKGKGIKEREEIIKKIYGMGKLKFGNTENIQETWKEVNELYSELTEAK